MAGDKDFNTQGFGEHSTSKPERQILTLKRISQTEVVLPDDGDDDDGDDVSTPLYPLQFSQLWQNYLTKATSRKVHLGSQFEDIIWPREKAWTPEDNIAGPTVSTAKK